MSQYRSIARPFAKAIFLQAKETGSLLTWEAIMKVLGQLVLDTQFSGLVTRPDVSSDSKQELVISCVKACVELSDRDQAMLSQVVMLLVKKNRLMLMAEIESLFLNELNKEQSIVKAEVVSAYPLSEQQRSAMIDKLAVKFGSTVEVEFHEDHSLIGGAIIRSGTWIMDGSLQHKLNQLKDSIRG